MRVANAESYEERRDAISHDWVRRLSAWKLRPILLPNSLSDPVDYLCEMNCDALILSGGDDIGATPERDACERKLFDFAMAEKFPTLGICRGLQAINVWLGGQETPVQGHVATVHEVIFTAALARFYGKTVEVNSYHQKGICADGLGEGLVPAAHDLAGFVEGVVYPGLPLAAVMWHPERGSQTDGDRSLLFHLLQGECF